MIDPVLLAAGLSNLEGLALRLAQGLAHLQAQLASGPRQQPREGSGLISAPTTSPRRQSARAMTESVSVVVARRRLCCPHCGRLFEVEVGAPMRPPTQPAQPLLLAESDADTSPHQPPNEQPPEPKEPNNDA